jgi:HK97 family phage prohead protease
VSTASRADLKQAREGLHNIPENRVSPRSQFELREVPNGTGGTNLRFTGFAAVTSAEYEMEDYIGPWIESVTVGAFRKTLNEGADVAFLLNHEGMTLARTKPHTLKLAEETNAATSPIPGVTGLHSEALLDPQNMYVQAMRSAVERGDLDEMSMAFRVIRQEWNDDYTRRWLNEISLHKGDVSLVNYAASPATGGTVALRQRLFGRGERPREALAGRSGSRTLIVLPDHVSRAKLDLARAGRHKGKDRTAHDLLVADIRAGRLSDPVAQARRDLAAARARRTS